MPPPNCQSTQVTVSTSSKDYKVAELRGDGEDLSSMTSHSCPMYTTILQAAEQGVKPKTKRQRRHKYHHIITKTQCNASENKKSTYNTINTNKICVSKASMMKDKI